MSSPSIAVNQPEDRFPKRSGDAFLAGMVAMLVLNVGQRIIGLARNVGFCHFLSESDLGLWALANSFFVIAAPIAVLGLPGSLGRFVEHFRLQGHLRHYLIRLTLACAFGTVLFCGLMFTFPQQTSVVLYGEAMPIGVVFWTAIALAFLILFNSTIELVNALRLVRLSSMMHLINTIVFTTVGVAGIAWFGNWLVLLPSYAIACLVAVIPGLWGAWVEVRAEASAGVGLPARAMWSRIVPFAFAIWFSNLLSNLFDLSDRYMLLYLIQTTQDAGQALVGQLYCGRILPNLLLSLGLMLAGILLPYLSADWERQQHDKISSTMNNMLVVLSLGFTGLSLGAMTFAPILFDWFLAGRYDQAAEILDLGMILACWSSLATVASAYLLCAEKGKQYVGMLSIGLLANLGLNWPLILTMGLYGAVLATTVTTGFLLTLLLWRVHREGCPIKRTTVIFCSVPICLALGPIAAATTLAVLTVLCGRTHWLLSDADRQSIDGLVIPYCQKVRLPMQTLWPKIRD